ncbi:MAG: sulfatase-like hydrolase/transferase [Bacteroidota bacterium]
MLLISITIGCGSKVSQSEKKKPNLLFILTDEQRYDTSGPYGNHQIKTPHLNSLGENSVVFQKAYVSQPVCSPARSTILTGLYPHSTGVTNNNILMEERVKALPELIRDTSYKTAYIGKWHLGRENDAWHGFDHRISTEDWYTEEDTTNQTDYNQWLQKNGFEPNQKTTNTFSRYYATTLPYEFSKSKFIETKGLEFLENNRDSPFIMYLSFLEPHFPYNGSFNTLHDASSIVLDSTYHLTEINNDAPLRYHMARGYGIPTYSVEELFARYWGLVHQVDLSVGAVLAKLRELGIEDTTIVVFTSEHGTMLQKFRINGKTVMYEESSRVPFIIKAPDIAPMHIHQPVGQIDLVPTLLDLLGQSIPEQLQGETLVPLMKGEKTEPRPVFMEWNPFVNWERDLDKCPQWSHYDQCSVVLQAHIRSVVTPDGWKLNWNTDDRSQLFNLNEDPKELNNLFGSKEHQERVRNLKGLIKDWQTRTNDKVEF